MVVVANQALAFDKSMLMVCPHIGDVFRPGLILDHEKPEVIHPDERSPNSGKRPIFLVVGKANIQPTKKEGLPMMLSSVGTQTRNAFALILHDSEQPWTMVMKGDGWKPAGRCPK
jgi:hypothetical protein